MRKLFVILVAIFLMASSAYAWVNTENNGPQNVVICYAITGAPMTSGNVVVLSTTSATRTVEFPGREVTGTATQGSAIYGVVIDTENYTAGEMNTGKFIRVQTHGYCPIINTASAAITGGAIAVGDGLCTSIVAFRAQLNGATGGRVTGSVVAFSAQGTGGASTGTVSGFIKGGL